MNTKFSLHKIFTTAVLIFYYIPICVLVVSSFNDSKYINIWGGLSLKWYRSILEDQVLLNVTLNSLKIACASATLSTIMGTLIAFVFVKIQRLRFRTLLIALLSIPFVIPEVIIGASMLLLFVTSKKVIGWPDGGSLATVMLAHMIMGISYVSVTVQSRLANVDQFIEEAAMDLGASPLRVFFLITLPTISKSLLVGWLLAFVLSFDDVVISSFTSGPESTTLPMLIYSRIKIGITPQVNALASIMLCAAIVILTVGYFLSPRNEESDEL
jgi:putrescine transport system permease protein